MNGKKKKKMCAFLPRKQIVLSIQVEKDICVHIDFKMLIKINFKALIKIFNKNTCFYFNDYLFFSPHLDISLGLKAFHWQPVVYELHSTLRKRKRSGINRSQ